MTKTIVDAGPLIAVLKKEDPDKEWVERVLQSLPKPLYTVEPVLTEVAYFVAAAGGDWTAILRKLMGGEFVIPQPLSALAAGAVRLGEAYPQADLADAAVVSLYEHFGGDAVVVTLDHNDFTAYRTADRKVVAFLSPKNSETPAHQPGT